MSLARLEADQHPGRTEGEEMRFTLKFVYSVNEYLNKEELLLNQDGVAITFIKKVKV